jgi:glucose/arabinose dehydrogenase
MGDHVRCSYWKLKLARFMGRARRGLMTQIFIRRELAICALMLSLSVSGRGADLPCVMVNAFPNLVLPDCVTATAVMKGEKSSQIVAMQRGLIERLPRDRTASKAAMFLDFRERMKSETDFEEGLHGIAFHPDFKNNRRFFLCYSQSHPKRTVLSEMKISPGPNGVPVPGKERVILEIPQPLGFHWGGSITFGPDGYLYLGIGDGGIRDDPYRLAQSPWSLNGKILRIDVNSRSGSLAYGIPADNPFVAKSEIRAEIWASGLRNPWGITFDPQTGVLWEADVGQDVWEEINMIVPGGNYGWSEREGPARFVTREKEKQEGKDFIDPVYAYKHDQGISITGGIVYRGKRLPALVGKYIFGDWGVGKLSALTPSNQANRVARAELLYLRGDSPVRFNPTCINVDDQGELLIFSHFPTIINTLIPPPSLADRDTDDTLNALPALPPSSGNTEDFSS